MINYNTIFYNIRDVINYDVSSFIITINYTNNLLKISYQSNMLKEYLKEKF